MDSNTEAAEAVNSDPCKIDVDIKVHGPTLLIIYFVVVIEHMFLKFFNTQWLQFRTHVVRGHTHTHKPL